MDGIAQDLVLGSVILLLPLLGLAWLIWRRRPADQPEPEAELAPTPRPDIADDDDPTYAFQKIRDDERRRFADELKAATPAPTRPIWLPQPMTPEEKDRWAKRGQQAGSDDRG